MSPQFHHFEVSQYRGKFQSILQSVINKRLDVPPLLVLKASRGLAKSIEAVFLIYMYCLKYNIGVKPYSSQSLQSCGVTVRWHWISAIFFASVLVGPQENLILSSSFDVYCDRTKFFVDVRFRECCRPYVWSETLVNQTVVQIHARKHLESIR